MNKTTYDKANDLLVLLREQKARQDTVRAALVLRAKIRKG